MFSSGGERMFVVACCDLGIQPEHDLSDHKAGVRGVGYCGGAAQ